MLLLRNSEEFLYSREGVTQGDPLSMLRSVHVEGGGGVVDVFVHMLRWCTL